MIFRVDTTLRKMSLSCQHRIDFCPYSPACSGGGREHLIEGEKPQPELKLWISFPQKMARESISTIRVGDEGAVVSGISNQALPFSCLRMNGKKMGPMPFCSPQ